MYNCVHNFRNELKLNFFFLKIWMDSNITFGNYSAFLCLPPMTAALITVGLTLSMQSFAQVGEKKCHKSDSVFEQYSHVLRARSTSALSWQCDWTDQSGCSLNPIVAFWFSVCPLPLKRSNVVIILTLYCTCLTYLNSNELFFQKNKALCWDVITNGILCKKGSPGRFFFPTCGHVSREFKYESHSQPESHWVMLMNYHFTNISSCFRLGSLIVFFLDKKGEWFVQSGWVLGLLLNQPSLYIVLLYLLHQSALFSLWTSHLG